jgi:MoaA/NifB/PqqE/SkfB family radical SAM enzyme
MTNLDITVALPDGAAASITSPAASDYPHKEAQKLITVNVAGKCNLKCPYCFIGRRIPMHIDKSDFSYIFDTFGENIHFIFGGIGDFFCGYEKSDRLLEYILEHDVTIQFDFNGVLLHELPELPPAMLDKIQVIDISFHYSAMKRAGVLRDWIKNVRAIARLFPSDRYYVKMILSLKDMELWSEAIGIFDKMIYPYTKQDLLIHLDAYDPHLRQRDIYNQTIAILKNFDHLNAPGTLEIVDPAAVGYFGPMSQKCPGGSRIFKVENTGQVKVCNDTWSRGMFDLGNVKRRDVLALNGDIVCPSVNNASCFLNMSKRFNLFPEYAS